jgi:putative ABC transport system permease protein
MDKTDKGFNSDAVLVVNHWRDQNGQLKVFAKNLQSVPGIRAVISQDHAPMGFAQDEENFSLKANDLSPQTVYVESGDETYIPFYQMKLLAGKNVSHTDSLHDLVINETYSKMLGFQTPAEAVGHSLYHNGKAYPVVGVVADFHQGSFHEAIHPCVIAKMPEREWSVAIKLQAGIKDPARLKAILAAMEAQWKENYPEEPFNCNFLNDSITWLYGQEQNTAWLINCAMCITIFISCMGLFGLAMFTAQRRTKEIGIRKVLGAGIADITALLSTDFIKLVVISLVIASPVAWYMMHQWLQDFVYRTTISWWIFAFAGLSAVGIALVTVSSQAIKAALVNPVKSLRSE